MDAFVSGVPSFPTSSWLAGCPWSYGRGFLIALRTPIFGTREHEPESTMATSTQRQRVVDWGRRSNVVWLDERVFWLNTLRRAVVNGAQILAAQQARVCALRAAGRDTALADSLLASFEDSQLALFRSLKRQEARHAGATLVGLRRGSTGVSARRS